MGQSRQHLHPSAANLQAQPGNEAGSLPRKPKRLQNIHAAKQLPRPLRPARLGAVDADPGHLQMEPTNLHPKHSDANPELSGRVHGVHHAAANEHMPKSVWQPGVVQRLADYIKHLRQVDQQPNQPDVASQPDQSGQPNERHVCTVDTHRTCTCPRGVCADDSATYRRARGPYQPAGPSASASAVPAAKSDQPGGYTCPVTGQPCTEIKCRDWCESGVDYSKT